MGAAGRRASGTRAWTMGRANAAVLPVPVAAWPSRSRPASSDGDGLALDRRGLLVAELGDGGDEVVGQAQVVEARLVGVVGGLVVLLAHP